MTPETNHDVDISIYYDYLEDQGIIVDREEEDDEEDFASVHEVGGLYWTVGGGEVMSSRIGSLTGRHVSISLLGVRVNGINYSTRVGG